MTDLLGPDAAGATSALTTTSDVSNPTAGDTWYGDCVGGAAGTGTPIVSKWLNWTMQQLRVAIRKANVPTSNSYDNMLSWALQSGYYNWVATVGGTTNALTGNVNNAPVSMVPTGTLVRGIAAFTNTGPATFNLNSFGADNIVLPDGSALIGGELVAGRSFMLMRVASQWHLISPLPLAYIIGSVPSTNVFTSIAVNGAVMMSNFQLGLTDATYGPTHSVVYPGAQGSILVSHIVTVYATYDLLTWQLIGNPAITLKAMDTTGRFTPYNGTTAPGVWQANDLAQIGVSNLPSGYPAYTYLVQRVS